MRKYKKEFKKKKKKMVPWAMLDESNSIKDEIYKNAANGSLYNYDFFPCNKNPENKRKVGIL